MIEPEITDTPPTAAFRRTQFTWKSITLFLLTAVVLFLCWKIAALFFSAVVGAITLAVVTDRPYRWLAGRWKRPALAACVSVSVVTLMIVTPLFFLIEELIRQALFGVNLLRTGGPQQKLAELVSRHAVVSTKIHAMTSQIDFAQASQNTANYVASHLAGVLSNTFGVLTQTVVMLFILFFLYRDGELAIATLRSLLPLEETETDVLLHRSGGTIYATALGRVAVAAVQGLAAGLAFWALGVGNAILWGLVTAVAAIIPAVGASLVWLPIAAFLAITGHWVKAGFLVTWGGLVVSTIDNFLYPMLVGSRLQQHTVAVFLSVVGAIALFGVSGLIIGPVLLTVAKTLIELWSSRTRAAL